jgi:hypothetical protein
MNDEVTKERMQLQAEYMQVWLRHAPKPPERGENSYDVFISYRSSDRAWAMALYDALKLAGWEPFLDQYDLVPGTNLETSLTENLQASASGVILWSSRTKASEWCKRERQAVTTLKDSRRNSLHPFNYVFATLDTEPLPLFAQSDLYIGFQESPEGPRGVNLLKLSTTNRSRFPELLQDVVELESVPGGHQTLRASPGTAARPMRSGRTTPSLWTEITAIPRGRGNRRRRSTRRRLYASAWNWPNNRR